ncbi:GntR family transcriptional regulator [Alicyclobacillus sp. ALC3]|uniref:GntR family transcriptional regulator n=1 Tax=Alicyclobacillus sp. ALC3 TaxID=2796143 RepID=UPI002379F960|nr:GntR family transcriptional regulator [Alicyclobacillus sp. ALC3]WDL98461.1 GntR family transcriptional regulator [Alicyclobacillus sp. ALC3]
MEEWRLDARSGIPLYLQLKQQIIQKIVQGDWEPGYQLPTVRQLAVDITINVNTVSRVYQEVEREGFIRTQQGKGTFVRPQEEWAKGANSRENLVSKFSSVIAEMAHANGITLSELISGLQSLIDSGKERP